MDIGAKIKNLQERCEYYDCSFNVSADENKTVTIICPSHYANLKPPLPTERKFGSIEQALLWFVSLMQDTNERCRRHKIEPIWDFREILRTYSLGQDDVSEQKRGMNHDPINRQQ